eukprot:g3514.t1
MATIVTGCFVFSFSRFDLFSHVQQLKNESQNRAGTSDLKKPKRGWPARHRAALAFPVTKWQNLHRTTPNLSGGARASCLLCVWAMWDETELAARIAELVPQLDLNTDTPRSVRLRLEQECGHSLKKKRTFIAQQLQRALDQQPTQRMDGYAKRKRTRTVPAEEQDKQSRKRKRKDTKMEYEQKEQQETRKEEQKHSKQMAIQDLGRQWSSEELLALKKSVKHVQKRCCKERFDPDCPLPPRKWQLVAERMKRMSVRASAAECKLKWCQLHPAAAFAHVKAVRRKVASSDFSVPLTKSRQTTLGYQGFRDPCEAPSLRLAAELEIAVGTGEG